MRVGIGYDVHKLVENRKLILGGVEIQYSKGLLGHSDADVLVHAIIDSILGAAGLGDIGKLFPDSDNKYKGISSLKLLKEVNALIKDKGYKIGNIDSTIIAQKPKISPYIEDIKKSLCNVLDIDLGSINIKATTEEGLGFTGRGEGISSQSICLLI
ncbi:2-C-methyl-D-erythritol 2,4-cyclodiphosphate synthase [Clostridium acetobutylicum]|uniref:2-C-methyl-D-erythritol 2,4-cyclodiphosphate synthase n=1 Tax=Clostridium acetobutylicum (strain ATCC 824 / DSM 792 / JCM 1419 / IAM 19013 / LMG 5710 / NBRC 13948 / NRRL B-527 / VKM B-1787 / 2291 / W) TaxID=272562 RepID=ISPF_CLOAB|nr:MULTISPECIES: 2-C-methyl-D-erythritol 2,4-cyclodiphosphate synthase [Clostridium]Q97LX0.1 RecName: Full=2-C-methyl-D-erythritol 2,4-cyclodiphosphate synthase; Short=MECDP-synthase; Short=MECPP-synthase; Short=MECPS [Clostridium acetobutylicum ATCC 824]AAK78414.1 Putative enzyme of deoxyxylulose pathway (terpenoid biosinthesis), YgbB family, similar to yacN B.subtilis [Clostridium acetobutylicum ATCC 824]ADZ19484.1 2-C-methyl-D-erythritol 2,4-cyclodiphosphate synthase [Clostridium acetobutylic